MNAKLTSKAQITIPKAIRRQLNLKPGDLLSFEQECPGKWVFAKASPENAAKGIANRLRTKTSVSIQEMDEAIRGRASEKHKKFGQ